MRPCSPELSAEAVCTRVCLLREEGPLVLRFSTPKGTDLKKGLEPFPLCSDELSGFSFKIGTKSSSNIDQPKSEENGDRADERRTPTRKPGALPLPSDSKTGTFVHSLTLKEPSSGAGVLLGAVHTSAHPGLTTSYGMRPFPLHKRTRRLCKVITGPRSQNPERVHKERTAGEFSGPSTFLQAT